MQIFRTTVWSFLCLFLSVVASVGKNSTHSEAAGFSMETVSFRGANSILHGYLYKPIGKEPFPAVIFYPDARKPLMSTGPSTQFDRLAKFWTDNGFLLFIPDHQPRTSISTDDKKDDVLVQQIQGIHKDVVAATEWLKAQSFTDDTRVVMMGALFGGTHTIVAAEKGLGLRGFIPFSPATISWSTNAMLQALLRRGVRNSKVPIFLIQTQNDTSLAPSAILGKELKTKGPPNRTKVYPPFGTSNVEARNFASNGCDIWGNDVLAFVREVLPQ